MLSSGNPTAIHTPTVAEKAFGKEADHQKEVKRKRVREKRQKMREKRERKEKGERAAHVHRAVNYT